MTPIQWAVFVTAITLYVYISSTITLEDRLNTNGKLAIAGSWLLLIGLSIRLWFIALYPILKPYW